MTDLEKVCLNCMATRPIEEFPSRGSGKTRTQCAPCFRNHANSKRRKPKEHKDIGDLPMTIEWVSSEEVGWLGMMIQILAEKDLLPNAADHVCEEFIDLQALLKSENRIARLVDTEIRNEKDRHLSESFNRRASESGRRLD